LTIKGAIVGSVSASQMHVYLIDIRYFITSLTDVSEFAYAARKHWSIENQLNWRLDAVFREDLARARKDNSPLNMNVLRKTALSLLKSVNVGRVELRKKMRRAASL
jgi:predicted transposase YbfD/YdcC